MKKSIIREIFMGERGNREKMPDSELLNRYIEDTWKYERILEKMLSDEQQEILREYTKALNGIEYEKEVLVYAEGFRLGFSVCMECLNEPTQRLKG